MLVDATALNVAWADSAGLVEALEDTVPDADVPAVLRGEELSRTLCDSDAVAEALNVPMSDKLGD